MVHFGKLFSYFTGIQIGSVSCGFFKFEDLFSAFYFPYSLPFASLLGKCAAPPRFVEINAFKFLCFRTKYSSGIFCHSSGLLCFVLFFPPKSNVVLVAVEALGKAKRKDAKSFLEFGC